MSPISLYRREANRACRTKMAKPLTPVQQEIALDVLGPLYFCIARARTTMTLVQPSALHERVNQESWGEDVSTAASVVEYMELNAAGVANAKTAKEIEDGATLCAPFNGVAATTHAFNRRRVSAVLHKLSQCASHTVLRRVGATNRFYVHIDAVVRLEDERARARGLPDVPNDVGANDARRPLGRVQPCVTPCCPFIGDWNPTDEQCSSTDFPEGPKCCGSCTGVRRDGRPMKGPHGVRCSRTPWLGVPNSEVDSFAWLHISSVSMLNETVNQMYGSARLVQAELDARLDGMSMQWEHHDRPGQHGTISDCILTVSKKSGAGQWAVEASGPTRKHAKLRAILGFLYCYKVLLEEAAGDKPVDYAAVWSEAADEVSGATQVWSAPSTANGSAQPVVVAVMRSSGASSTDQEERVAPAAPAAEVPAVANPRGNIWASAPPVSVPTQPRLKITRAMMAVARHHTPVYAVPNVATQPKTKYVPISALRLAMARISNGNTYFNRFTDDEILNAFTAESAPADTASHGRVARFARDVLDPTRMRPVDEAAVALMQIAGEPCLVVRMKRNQ